MNVNQTLLFADADAELCEVYRTFFTAHGYDVEIASDGLECLGKVRDVPPAVVVLDVELRWGGGDGVLAWLREASPTHPIPIILTMAGCPQDFADFMEPPVVDYLHKPFAPNALLESVRSALGKEGQGEPPNRYCVPAYSELFIG